MYFIVTPNRNHPYRTDQVRFLYFETFSPLVRKFYYNPGSFGVPSGGEGVGGRIFFTLDRHHYHYHHS